MRTQEATPFMADPWPSVVSILIVIAIIVAFAVFMELST